VKKGTLPRGTRDKLLMSGESQYALLRLVMLRNIGLKQLAKGLMKDPANTELPLALMFVRMFRQSYGAVNLNHPQFRALVQRALKKNDVRFFKAIGRELAQHGPDFEDAASKLEWFLIQHWDGSIRRIAPKAPPLNVLNRESLAVVCNQFLKRPGDKHPFTEDAVEKTRQRLSLKPAKGQKLHVIQVSGKLKILLKRTEVRT